MSLVIDDVVIESVYVAGPMRGYPNFNFDAFMLAEGFLRAWYEIEVYNPARKDKEAGFDPDGMEGTLEEMDTAGFNLKDALSWDMQRIIYDADALILLEGWERSLGARAEFFLARALGKPTYEWSDGMFYEIGEEVPNGAV